MKGKKGKNQPSKNPNDDRENEIWTNFYDSIKSDASRYSYERELKSYMKFDSVTKYSELIDRDIEVIKKSIKNYLSSLQKRDLSTSYIKFTKAAIKHFYDMNDIENLGWKKLSKFMGAETEFYEDRAYTKEEIKKIIDVADFRLKVCVLLECTAGLRVGSLPTLKIGHLTKKEDCYKIDVYKGLKGNGKYFTFCSPAAANAIDEYLDFRKRHDEIITDDSPLLRADFNTEDPDKRKDVKGIVRNTIMNDIIHYLVVAGLRTIDRGNIHNRKDVKTNHGMRKFYDSALVKSGMHPHVITRLIGHSKKHLDQRYVRLTEDELFKEYKKAIPYLVIDPTIELTEKVEEQQKQLNKEEMLRLDYARLLESSRADKKIMEERLNKIQEENAETMRQMQIIVQSFSKEKGKHHTHNLTKPDTPPSEQYHITTRNVRKEKVIKQEGQPDKITYSFEPKDMAFYQKRKDGTIEVITESKMREMVEGKDKRKKSK